MRARALLIVGLAALLGGLATPGVASRARADDEVESPARLAAVARAAAGRETGRPPAELEVATIDPRLRLAPCATPPVGRLAPGTRAVTQLTIEVRCPAPAWRQFIAVRVRAEEPVVVAARPLGRLDVVTAEDLAVVPRDLASLPAGYFRQPADVVGRVAQRTIGVGEVLAPTSVRAPPLVRRGQNVTLMARAGGLAVHMNGVALADAGLAERVTVRNSSSGRQVQGIVRSGDTVEVSLE